MLIAEACRIEALDDPGSVWDATVAALRSEGIATVLHLTSDADQRDVRLLTTTPEIHAEALPRDDPFLRHCCGSYEITLTGAEYIDGYDYLDAEARAFILTARGHGFVSGLGLPMRLRGSQRFGGFNLGTNLPRAEFEAEIVPRQDGFRTFCLIAHRRLEELAPSEPNGADSALDLLTPREREVIWLQAQGLPRKEVARRCGLSPHTVAEYASNAYRKLGVRNRTAAAKIILGH